jgi:hypothetical protein
MKNFADDSIGNFESPADPAHAPGLNESGATNEGIGRESDPRGSREVGARGHEADACHAADAARGSGEETAREEKDSEKVNGGFIPYTSAMDELFVYLQAQKLPKVVHARLGIVLEKPVKLFCLVGEPHPASYGLISTPHIEPGFYASDLLIKLVAAARALDWKLVAILLEHADASCVEEIEVTEGMISSGVTALSEYFLGMEMLEAERPKAVRDVFLAMYKGATQKVFLKSESVRRAPSF